MQVLIATFTFLMDDFIKAQNMDKAVGLLIDCFVHVKHQM